jgi:hypothetical protein
VSRADYNCISRIAAGLWTSGCGFDSGNAEVIDILDPRIMIARYPAGKEMAAVSPTIKDDPIMERLPFCRHNHTVMLAQSPRARFSPVKFKRRHF